jgi:nucleoside-diphosphate-sugar epimerase
MKILITGAAGNLGSLLTRHLLGSGHELRLLTHRRPVSPEIRQYSNVKVYRADLARPETLVEPCRGADAVVHFAGVLFAPRPEKFLPVTNVRWFENLVAAALAGAAGKIILVSFPHVAGPSSPDNPAPETLDGRPDSVHARTRLAAEKRMFAACEGTATAPVALRPGMIYGRGVLMIEAARWLARRRLLAVWPEPTPIHLLALPDFNRAVVAAVEKGDARGVYNLGDDAPITLQDFLDAAAAHWGYRRPWRFPRWSFNVAGAAVELFAGVFGTRAPLTRDFIRIGMAGYWADTSRMKAELLPALEYPTLRDGINLL